VTEKTEPKKRLKSDPLFSPSRGGTFVKDKAVAERMMAGSQRHLGKMDQNQAELRVRGIKVSPNKLRGAIRHARRELHHKAFEGTDGFSANAALVFRGAGPQGKAAERAAARKRAEEFNAKVGAEPEGIWNG
jgi:hypothetical protein